MSHPTHALRPDGAALAPHGPAAADLTPADTEPKALTNVHDAATAWPWYRSESWLAVELSALVPIAAALLVPMAYRMPFIILGALLVVLGLTMLVRQGPFADRSRPTGALADPPGTPARRARP